MLTSLFLASMLQRASARMEHASFTPQCAAACRGVQPSWSRTSRSQPAWTSSLRGEPARTFTPRCGFPPETLPLTKPWG